MSRLQRLILAVLILGMPGTLCAAGAMKEGMWEITTSTEMPGIPYKIPPTVVKQCYTREDVSDQKKIVASDNKDCAVTDFKSSGNKVAWTMKCTGEHSGTFKGETTFSSDSYTSVMKMETEGQVITMNVKAKRVGACP